MAISVLPPTAPSRDLALEEVRRKFYPVTIKFSYEHARTRVQVTRIEAQIYEYAKKYFGDRGAGIVLQYCTESHIYAKYFEHLPRALLYGLSSRAALGEDLYDWSVDHPNALATYEPYDDTVLVGIKHIKYIHWTILWKYSKGEQVGAEPRVNPYELLGCWELVAAGKSREQVARLHFPD